MIIFITGASHTGKTLLAQKLMERCHIPYLSIDHLKMGLIRSRQTSLTPYDDYKLEAYLWPILQEMAKTVLENSQNLIIEGCYIPADCVTHFDEKQRDKIRPVCLVMTEKYLRNHFDAVKAHANAIEKRLDDSQYSLEELLADNKRYMEDYSGWEQILIDDNYDPLASDQIFWPRPPGFREHMNHNSRCGREPREIAGGRAKISGWINVIKKA